MFINGPAGDFGDAVSELFHPEGFFKGSQVHCFGFVSSEAERVILGNFRAFLGGFGWKGP